MTPKEAVQEEIKGFVEKAVNDRMSKEDIASMKEAIDEVHSHASGYKLMKEPKNFDEVKKEYVDNFESLKKEYIAYGVVIGRKFPEADFMGMLN